MGNPWINGEFIYDMAKNNIFTKNDDNYINGVGKQELDTIGDLYLLDIFLNKDNHVDLHYHANASELTYCVKGAAEICFINPTTEEWECFDLTEGEVISIPQGFWHTAKALVDDTHILATHDTDNLQTTFGSDLLRLTPKEVMVQIYCLDEERLAEALAPIDETIVIGPPRQCEKGIGDKTEEDMEARWMKDNESIMRAALEESEGEFDNDLNVTKNPREEINEDQVNETMRAIPRIESSLYICPICKQKRNRS